ncbi:hypothetical protein HYQ46_003377 [Verticillium longisporum]|nr:hypothetical protein HYQ46_003377 [Verticillium longisporum]
MAAKTTVGEGATPDPIQKLNADADSLRREAESSLEYAAKLEEENQRRQAQIVGRFYLVHISFADQSR